MARIPRWAKRTLLNETSGKVITNVINIEHDKDECFILRKCLSYLKRHLNRYFVLDDETMSMICWILGHEMKQIGVLLLELFEDDKRSEFQEDLLECGSDSDEYARVVIRMLKRLRNKNPNRLERLIFNLLEQRMKYLNYRGISNIEKNVSNLKMMFKLSGPEIELCIFLFIISAFKEAESFFDDHINCTKFSGKKYLFNILDLKQNEIWITNNIDNVEESVLRRFAYSLHFKPFSYRHRIQLWDNILRKNKVKRFSNRSDIEYLAKKYHVSAGAIDIAVKKAIEIIPNSKKEFHHSASIALDAHLMLMHSGEKPVNKNQIEKNYSLDGLNIHGDVLAIIDQLEKFDRFLRNSDHDNILNMNLLFYGPPGTGKSELARYIAEHLDREIIYKRYSDLQSMWVGEGEKNIKYAFAEAEAEEAILVIDEADSLLFSRDRAIRSFEASFTNEFLTQMERYKGILICTTNRLKDLDHASIRRFNHKVEFDYLKAKGNVIFYKKFFPSLVKSRMDDNALNVLKEISNLAPGDFKTVRDRYSFYPPEDLSHEQLLQALKEEARIKNIHKGNKRIGF